MEWPEGVSDFIINTLAAEVIAVIVGLTIFRWISSLYIKLKYGGWHVILLERGETILDDEVSAEKMKECREEKAELRVFLKGVISPYTWLNCDPIRKGREVGLLREDYKNKEIIVDLDKNPPQKSNSRDRLGRQD